MQNAHDNERKTQRDNGKIVSSNGEGGQRHQEPYQNGRKSAHKQAERKHPGTCEEMHTCEARHIASDGHDSGVSQRKNAEITVHKINPQHEDDVYPDILDVEQMAGLLSISKICNPYLLQSSDCNKLLIHSQFILYISSSRVLDNMITERLFIFRHKTI